jgi:hypothetical protein
MFPVRYELNSYINLLRNLVFKGMIDTRTVHPCNMKVGFVILLELVPPFVSINSSLCFMKT